jgi:hypothetical protein
MGSAPLFSIFAIEFFTLPYRHFRELSSVNPLSRNNRDSALLRGVRILLKNEAKTQPSDDKCVTIEAATTEL